MSKKQIAKYPWVFWIKISYRPKWFKKFWKTRGSNFIEYQIWLFKVNIGLPWLRTAVDSKIRDHGSAIHVHNTNEENSKQLFSFLIKIGK